MFIDGSFLFCKHVSKEHSCRIIMLYLRNIPTEQKCYPISGLLGEDFKRFFTLIAMATEFFIEHNYLKKFERGRPKEHS